MQDDTGHEVAIGEVRRVVSIVPSLTEALAETHQDLLVGVTDWCTHPADLSCARVRGTKNPDVDAIVALQPDLVLANSEENREPDLQALREAGVAVWVTYPRTVPQAIESLGRMLTACGVERPAWLDAAAASWAAPHEGPRRTAVIPIWRKPWMAVGSDTFTGDVLERLGIDNVLGDHEERYPRFDPTQVTADLAVLPDEPYLFTPDDGPEAFPGMDSRCVSGRLLTWYGPSLAQAREVLTAALA